MMATQHSLRSLNLGQVGLFFCFLIGLTAAAPQPKNILFLGDSITAGYGLEPSQAYPALIQEKIDAKKWPFRTVNAGQSGDTSASGLNRLDWLLRSRVDILVLELGGNDGLRGLPPETTRENLQAIIELTRKKYPQVKIILAGMKVPPNMGADYAKKFATIYTDLAKKHDALLIPFVLEHVGGIRELNLPDGIHPTTKGHEIVAANVWKVLEPLLQSLTSK
jgi:acyl-CoA thioesterase-1